MQDTELSLLQDTELSEAMPPRLRAGLEVEKTTEGMMNDVGWRMISA